MEGLFPTGFRRNKTRRAGGVLFPARRARFQPAGDAGENPEKADAGDKLRSSNGRPRPTKRRFSVKALEESPNSAYREKDDCTRRAAKIQVERAAKADS